jgi:hypothetical protein
MVQMSLAWLQGTDLAAGHQVHQDGIDGGGIEMMRQIGRTSCSALWLLMHPKEPAQTGHKFEGLQAQQLQDLIGQGITTTTPCCQQLHHQEVNEMQHLVLRN